MKKLLTQIIEYRAKKKAKLENAKMLHHYMSNISLPESRLVRDRNVVVRPAQRRPKVVSGTPYQQFLQNYLNK
jgi:hypothetical protein